MTAQQTTNFTLSLSSELYPVYLLYVTER